MSQELRCKTCGRQPAQRFVIRRHVGMVFLQKFYKIDAVLCRDHALEYSKSFLSKTLVQGWWGLISFFMNMGAVATDVGAIGKAKKMPPPQGTPVVSIAWAPPPASPPPPPPPPPRPRVGSGP